MKADRVPFGTARSPVRWAASWERHKSLVLELFVLSNFAFLTLDIYLAHSVNRFRHPAEWIPFWFSAVAAAALVPCVFQQWKGRGGGASRLVGLCVGYFSIAVGIVGLIYHLDSQFFNLWTLKSLVYTAPFSAPLCYAGLGFLLILNRMVDHHDREWSQWVTFFALGGFVGNFVLSLADHAQNGFFHLSEWIPVGASAFAIGFLFVALGERDRRFYLLCLAVLVLQALVGVLGFYLHLDSSVNSYSSSLFENFVHGAPILAPMLFADIFLLGAIGIGEGLLRRGVGA